MHCLYTSTDGPAWACSEGWDNLFETDLSSLYGVSAEAGRVTKISLGANNLDGGCSFLIFPTNACTTGTRSCAGSPRRSVRGRHPSTAVGPLER